MQLAPGWEAAFGSEPGLGPNDSSSTLVLCSAVFDDGLGDGPVLYVGGSFGSAGGRPMGNLARWDGSEWTNPGAANQQVLAMAVHDDGSGEKLYVGGIFSSVGGVAANRIACFDGTTWAPVAGGANGFVHTLQRVIDGSAEYLLAGGEFTTIGGLPANRAALLLGGSWVPFGNGFNGTVRTFTVHDGEIFAGGEFTASGVTPLSRLARWTGTEWVDVNGGVGGTVYTLLSWGAGVNFGLHVGGQFNTVGGTTPVTANALARWHAGSWTQVGGGVAPQVRALAAWDDGGGEDLYITGHLTWAAGSSVSSEHVFRWDGTNFQPLDAGLEDQAYNLIVHDDGAGESLWVGGGFSLAGVVGANSLARWNGSAWFNTGYGLNDRVYAITSSTTFLGGPTLFLGGAFATPGTAHDRGLAAWQPDVGFIPLGAISEDFADVRALVEFDDGSGPRLFVGGTFVNIGGISAQRIATWNGSTWGGVGGLSGWCLALAVYDDGTGPALYAAGSFSSAGGTPAASIARWNGSSWSALGSGVGALVGTAVVYALEVFDDGTGPALYAAGNFSMAGGAPAVSIARWDGTSWSNLGSGLLFGGGSPGSGRALEVYDSGCGAPQLYVGGDFVSAGGVPGTLGLGRWDGSAWSSAGGPGSSVRALQAFDDGSGPSLFVGGFFTSIGTVPAARIARYNGAGWAALGAGVLPGNVDALGVFDDLSGDGPRLLVGGEFSVVPDVLPEGASRLAAWNGLGSFNTWTDLGFALAGITGDPLLTATGALQCGELIELNLSNAAPSALAALFLATSSTPTPFAGGTLIPVPFLGPYYFTTTPLGTLPLAFTMPDPLPPGFELYAQWAIVDAAGPFGKSLSNALRGDVP
ncbi:MAG: hypothetical protein ACT4PU_07155 [Planctomycetota bacterium]